MTDEWFIDPNIAINVTVYEVYFEDDCKQMLKIPRIILMFGPVSTPVVAPINAEGTVTSKCNSLKSEYGKGAFIKTDYHLRCCIYLWSKSC